MAERDALVRAYEHLDRMPRAADALHMLRKIASLVKPMMRKRGWTVGILTEFYPEAQNLLGLNVNRGQKICVRLRYPRDKSLFLPIEETVDTMLHELCHNVHGPHNEAFHALWEELRDEHEELVRKGYTGEGFLSEGQRLGGGRLPVHEMQRQARVAAERRTMHTRNSGQTVGGAYVPQGVDIRTVIADAAQRRIQQTRGITQGCASGTSGAETIADQASQSGFKTKAEEDEANDRAISQALWELVQEEESRKAGISDDNWRSEGLTWNPDMGLQPAPANVMSTMSSTGLNANAKQNPPSIPFHTKPQLRSEGKPQSALSTPSRKRPLSPDTSSAVPMSTSQTTAHTTWPCTICTLVNPINYLCCDACGSERPPQFNPCPPKEPKIKKEPSRTSSSTSSILKSKSGPNNLLPEGESAYRKPPAKLGWNCGRCGSFMEHQWWTCSLCGTMKDSS